MLPTCRREGNGRGTVVPVSSTGDEVRGRRRRDLILHRLVELRLTQTELGEQAGLSKSAITRVLKGDRNPQTRTLERLAAALSLPLAQLVDPPEFSAHDRELSDDARAPRDAILTSGSVPRPAGRSSSARRSTATDAARGGQAVWYPVYRWGMRVDPRRRDIARRGTYLERPVPVGDETERIGPEGFGLELNDASLSNWEGAENQPLGREWIVWCNPDARDGVQDGDLVVAADPTRGLHAGVYRETDDGLYLETDDAGGHEQERRRTERGQVIGPVVMATLLGGVPRRRQRRLGAGDAGGQG